MSLETPDKFLAELDTEGVVETRELVHLFPPPRGDTEVRTRGTSSRDGSPLLTFFKRNWKSEIFSCEPCKL